MLVEHNGFNVGVRVRKKEATYCRKWLIVWLVTRSGLEPEQTIPILYKPLTLPLTKGVGHISVSFAGLPLFSAVPSSRRPLILK